MQNAKHAMQNENEIIGDTMDYVKALNAQREARRFFLRSGAYRFFQRNWLWNDPKIGDTIWIDRGESETGARYSPLKIEYAIDLPECARATDISDLMDYDIFFRIVGSLGLRAGSWRSYRQLTNGWPDIIEIIQNTWKSVIIERDCFLWAWGTGRVLDGTFSGARFRSIRTEVDPQCSIIISGNVHGIDLVAVDDWKNPERRVLYGLGIRPGYEDQIRVLIGPSLWKCGWVDEVCQFPVTE